MGRLINDSSAQRRLRYAFIRMWASILKKYKNILKLISNTHNLLEVMNKFYEIEKRSDIKHFLKDLVKTQNFTTFIEERISPATSEQY